jgi:Cdc6-like AAA superfamily ATPase
MPSTKKSPPPADNNISINGDVKDSAVIIGDNNTVNQTFIQKFFNIFKSDSETLEHRNRRILLRHVENAWIKDVLDASLQGAALLDLGIKQDPEAVTKYPWAIKKESTDETLPAGTSMLEIFNSISMGRSLLILGAPGSGKTIMLLELARQLISACQRRHHSAHPDGVQPRLVDEETHARRFEQRRHEERRLRPRTGT